MAVHEHMGLQFDGAAIAKIAGEIMRQKEAKRDLVYPTSRLSYSNDGQLVFAGSDKTFEVDGRLYLDWNDAERAADEAAKADRPATIVPKGPAGSMPLNPTAAAQLLQRLEVPGLFASSLRRREFSDVLGNLIRDLIAKQEAKRWLVRTIDGKVRAILSDRYRILDNADLFFCAAEKFGQVGATAWKARLWDDGFELFGVAEHITAEVSTDRTFDPGDGWASRWYGKSGDAHNAAVRISNSETGEGGLNVKLACMRRVCANFNVWADGVAIIHAGKTQEATDGIIRSDETRQKESELVWLKVGDAISTAFNVEKFRDYMESLNKATTQKLADPTTAVENVTEAYSISDERKHLILAALLGSGDASRFGLCQAITFAAHSNTGAAASRLEEIGGEVISMSDAKFAQLVGV